MPKTPEPAPPPYTFEDFLADNPEYENQPRAQAELAFLEFVAKSRED